FERAFSLRDTLQPGSRGPPGAVDLDIIESKILSWRSESELCVTSVPDTVSETVSSSETKKPARRRAGFGESRAMRLQGSADLDLKWRNTCQAPKATSRTGHQSFRNDRSIVMNRSRSRNPPIRIRRTPAVRLPLTRTGSSEPRTFAS